MNHPTLEALRSDEFIIRFSVTDNPRAIHQALERCEEVDAIRLAFCQEQIDEGMLRDFVARVLQGLQPGVLFPYDVAIAAVAVAVESHPIRFADEFLSQLSRLDRPELPLSTRVGRECQRIHSRLASNVSRVCSLVPDSEVPSGWEETPALVETDCEEHRRDAVYEVA